MHDGMPHDPIQGQGQGHETFKVRNSPGRLMLRQEVCHIFQTERPTNLKLGAHMEYEDPYHRQAP